MPLVLRETKGEKLTIAEVDGNFTYLNDSITDLSGSVQPLVEAAELGHPLTIARIKDYKPGDGAPTYTLTDQDAGKLILTDNEETNVVISIPIKLSNSPFITKFIRTGTGTVQIYGQVGVTVNSKNGHLFISSQYGQAELISNELEEYFLIGDLSAS